MRKKVLLLPMLMTIVLLSACAKDPKKVYEDQLHKQVNTMATKVGSTYRTVFEDAQKNNGYNVDYTLKDLKVSGQEFDDFKLALTADTYEKNTKVAATLSYDDEKMITGEMYVDPKKIYFMLPDYSKKALSVENASEKEMKLPDMPKADQIEAQLKDYGTMLVDTFKYTGCEKKATFDENNYKFDASIMTGECTSKDLEKTMEDISDKFKDSELNKSLEEWMEMGDVDPDDAKNLEDGVKDKVIKDDDTKLQLKLYDGKKDNMAYEIINTENKNRIVFVTDGTSWSIYCAEKDDIIGDLTYHIDIDGKDISGYLKFAAKDGGALRLEFSDVKLSGKKISSCDYKLLAGEKEDDLKPVAEGKFTKDEKTTTISVKIEVKELYELSGELEISISKRDPKSFELPTDSVDVDKMSEWSTSLDMQKLQSDFMKFNDLYTKIQSIVNPYQSYDYNEDMKDNSYLEDSSANENGNEGETNASQKESKFTYFTNYEDDGSYVYFNPSKEEVMAKGEPSTGLTIICRDPKAIKKIENFLAKTDMAKQNEKVEAETYTVTGPIGEDESTWDQDTTYGMEWENQISYRKDALTGELSYVQVNSPDKDFVLKTIKAVFETATGEDGSGLLKEASDGYWSVENKDKTINAYVIENHNDDNTVYYSSSVCAY